jgi:hypothetical protein
MIKHPNLSALNQIDQLHIDIQMLFQYCQVPNGLNEIAYVHIVTNKNYCQLSLASIETVYAMDAIVLAEMHRAVPFHRTS